MSNPFLYNNNENNIGISIVNANDNDINDINCMKKSSAMDNNQILFNPFIDSSKQCSNEKSSKTIVDRDLINFRDFEPTTTNDPEPNNDYESLKIELIKFSVQINSKFDKLSSLVENINKKVDIIEYRLSVMNK